MNASWLKSEFTSVISRIHVCINIHLFPPPIHTHTHPYTPTHALYSAYVNMFMRHLCEPDTPTSTTYSDSVPKENASRQNILTRIGIMRLVRNKVRDGGGSGKGESEGMRWGSGEKEGKRGGEEGEVASYPGPRVECGKGPGDSWQVFLYVLNQHVTSTITFLTRCVPNSRCK